MLASDFFSRLAFGFIDGGSAGVAAFNITIADVFIDVLDSSLLMEECFFG